MTARSIRRAQERKAKKLARKAAISPELAVVETAEPETETVIAPEISPARLAANRANSSLSTGPRTEEGKARSAGNALKTALTGRTVLLPSDDAAAYEHYLERFINDFNPAGLRESELVQSIADTNWRLRRIPTLEFALYARGHAQFAEQFANEPADAQTALINLETYLFYEKQFRNLQLQESRLRRQREKDLADLRALQQERHQHEAQQLAAAAALYQSAKSRHRPFHPADHGFEFSLAAIESYLEGAQAAHAMRELAQSAA